MGKSSGTQTTNYSPWAPAQPALTYGINEAGNIYNAMTPGAMAPTFTTSSPTWNITGISPSGAPQYSYGMAPGGQGLTAPAFDPNSVTGYSMFEPAAAELEKYISGAYLNAPNPYLEDVIGRSMADVNSIFAGQGRYGSGAHLDQLFTKAAAPIRYQDYAQQQANQLMAIGALPSFQQAYAAAPYADLSAYMGLVNPIASGGSQVSQELYSNPLAGAAGGALSGAALGSMVAPVGAEGIAAVGGWPFLLGGALLGGFAT